MKGNTPDFILEHFIVFFLDDTQWAPTRWGPESNSHGYSAQPHSELRLKVKPKLKPCKMHNKQVLQSHSIILSQLQYITRQVGASRRAYSKDVARTVKMT